jgi:hypothetical protein
MTKTTTKSVGEHLDVLAEVKRKAALDSLPALKALVDNIDTLTVSQLLALLDGLGPMMPDAITKQNLLGIATVLGNLPRDLKGVFEQIEKAQEA